MKTILCALFAACLLIGCTTDFTEVKQAELDRAFILNSSPTFKGYYYLGSDDAYHYFVGKWKYGKDRYFKTPKTDLPITREDTYGQSESQVFPFKPSAIGAELFCTIGETKIYREKGLEQGGPGYPPQSVGSPDP